LVFLAVVVGVAVVAVVFGVSVVADAVTVTATVVVRLLLPVEGGDGGFDTGTTDGFGAVTTVPLVVATELARENDGNCGRSTAIGAAGRHIHTNHRSTTRTPNTRSIHFNKP
jgi:hypothetical protein